MALTGEWQRTKETLPVTIASDSAFGTRNFHALHVGNDGALYVAWLEATQGKSKTFLTRSTDQGTTWSTPAMADANQSCPCCRTCHALPCCAIR